MEISTFLTILLFPSIAALANCEFETDIEAWDCQTYKQYFQYEQQHSLIHNSIPL